MAGQEAAFPALSVAVATAIWVPSAKLVGTAALQFLPVSVAVKVWPAMTTVTPVIPELGEGSTTRPLKVGVPVFAITRRIVGAGATVSTINSSAVVS